MRCTRIYARDSNMYVQWYIQYIQGLQRGVTAGEQPAPGSGGAGSRSGAGLKRWRCMHGIYTRMRMEIYAMWRMPHLFPNPRYQNI